MSWVPVTGDHAQAAYLAGPRQALEQAREEALTPMAAVGRLRVLARGGTTGDHEVGSRRRPGVLPLGRPFADDSAQPGTCPHHACHRAQRWGAGSGPCTGQPRRPTLHSPGTACNRQGRVLDPPSGTWGSEPNHPRCQAPPRARRMAPGQSPSPLLLGLGATLCLGYCWRSTPQVGAGPDSGHCV